ncbi:MAG: hypothetical protein LBF22_03255 [Deltaproteobacteria bacterium]|jgi:hypothetical protein|nr:hypothetical protein [Deltaproteobacteria bacterium]
MPQLPLFFKLHNYHTQAGKFLRGIYSQARALFGLGLIWALSLLIVFRGELANFLAPLFFVSALILSGAKTPQLLKPALIFLLFWGLFRGLFLPYLGESSWSVLKLAAWIFLGMHLFFIWSPLELGWAFQSLARPLVGRKTATLFSISLVVLVKIIPSLLEDAKMTQKFIRLRAKDLKLTVKILLWGQNLLRLTFQRTEGLTRALSKRRDVFLR